MQPFQKEIDVEVCPAIESQNRPVLSYFMVQSFFVAQAYTPIEVIGSNLSHEFISYVRRIADYDIRRTNTLEDTWQEIVSLVDVYLRERSKIFLEPQEQT